MQSNEKIEKNGLYARMIHTKLEEGEEEGKSRATFCSKVSEKKRRAREQRSDISNVIARRSHYIARTLTHLSIRDLRITRCVCSISTLFI